MRLGLCVNRMEKKFFLKQSIELVPFRLQFPAFLPQGLFFQYQYAFQSHHSCLAPFWVCITQGPCDLCSYLLVQFSQSLVC